ncbi:hypothetical protein FA95DRAFT_1614328 [Auriscalpium vulgare]|uniref:Uncharacterized protein n=1 Tax=Auriscalpium vulgare TaxID=40419 RepID=A0ACB8R0A9_9AGAM|nr:hypothetical protein FA95DRAFT_1614328 [Auriscalpium vulgare]
MSRWRSAHPHRLALHREEGVLEWHVDKLEALRKGNGVNGVLCFIDDIKWILFLPRGLAVCDDSRSCDEQAQLQQASAFACDRVCSGQEQAAARATVRVARAHGLLAIKSATERETQDPAHNVALKVPSQQVALQVPLKVPHLPPEVELGK